MLALYPPRVHFRAVVNLTPANPIRIQRAGLLPADEWAAIDKAVLAEQKSAATAASKPSTKSAGRG